MKQFTAGWGLTDSETETIPTILQYTKVKYITLNAVNLSNEHLDSCNGDSGGALTQVLIGDNGPKYYVNGLVSFGVKKCGGKRPAVYTKILHYLNFILEIIGDDLQTWVQ